MTIVLRILGALGMLWSVAVIALIILLCKREEIPIEWPAIVFYGVVFFVWWRCYCLRRTGALLSAAYCVWMALIGFQVGLWEWVMIFGATAALLAAATCVAWDQLKTGL